MRPPQHRTRIIRFANAKCSFEDAVCEASELRHKASRRTNDTIFNNINYWSRFISSTNYIHNNYYKHHNDTRVNYFKTYSFIIEVIICQCALFGLLLVIVHRLLIHRVANRYCYFLVIVDILLVKHGTHRSKRNRQYNRSRVLLTGWCVWLVSSWPITCNNQSYLLTRNNSLKIKFEMLFCAYSYHWSIGNNYYF